MEGGRVGGREGRREEGRREGKERGRRKSGPFTYTWRYIVTKVRLVEITAEINHVHTANYQ